MSKKQWGHGYHNGYESGYCDSLKEQCNYDFSDEVMFWYLNMCISNRHKTYDRSLFPVGEFISMLHFCGYDIYYAKKVYDWLMKYGEGDYFKYNDTFYSFYISGESWNDWKNDYFVIDPCDTDDEENEYYELKYKILDKINQFKELKKKKGIV